MRGMDVALPSNGAMPTGNTVLDTDSRHHMGPVYTADSIRKTRWRKGGLEYFVKWKGWPTKFNTWEPGKHILDVTLIKLFEQRKARARQRKLSVRRTNGHSAAGRVANERPLHAVILKDGKKCYATKKERAKSKPRPPPCASLLKHHPAAKTDSSSRHSPTVSDTYRPTTTHSQHTVHSTVTTEQKTAESDRENKSRAPQLDCLRGIKFKLGWRYNRRQSTGELGAVFGAPFTKRDVNALTSPPPGGNPSVVIPPFLFRESHQEAKRSDYIPGGPPMERGGGVPKPPLSKKIKLAFQELQQLEDCRDFADQFVESRRKMSIEGSDDVCQLAGNISATGKGAEAAEADAVSNDVITEGREHCDNIDVKNNCQNEVNNNNRWSSCGEYSEKGIGMVLLREHNVWNVKSTTNH